MAQSETGGEAQIPLTVEFSYVHFAVTRSSPVGISAGIDSSFGRLLVHALTVSISGGLEMLFSDQRKLSLTIPALDKDGKPSTMALLIDHLSQKVMEDSRKELFILDQHLRPGILVLINDADWELEGEEAYQLQNGDNILFVSTLHGG
ncbi:hypothetical protein S7711_06429 [Stachybotrys chartarum IBT 7711]|uniref:Ubiquitin-related modifier 1 n=1 Tax=Stachybotrys chartarum (strain CBS 109288 / IBT 7711) TaxID=1280523 RepID=A0A084AX44_STACB|nr:hypothetical protein S7711_06429 [Stachybotrys chartarum IBT 7711]KFA54769.1 hypothetical protein S40293_00823 [Stachybotrys chartarum IBT 40293]KFA76323.1 hypothetical protein S40288_02986 [Stachybotrys chartarum IBT 40288]